MGRGLRKLNDNLTTNVQNSFNDKQQALTINTEELIAIYYSLCSFKHLLHGQGILVHCDNVTAIAYVKNKGSSHPLWDKLKRRLFDLVFECNASLQITYINTKYNKITDKLSREVLKYELTEWEIDTCMFELIKVVCECRLDIDLFASGVNHKLPWFATWTTEEEAEIVDAFTVIWQNFIPFLNPPFSLWSGVLCKLQEDKKTRQDKTSIAVGLAPCSQTNPGFQ